MAEKYTNIRVILDKITRHPLLSSVTLELAIDYTVDFMNIVGVPAMFSNKIETVFVDNYKGKLPCDFVSLVQIRGKNGMYRHATNNYHMMPQSSESGHTYMIQGGYIFVSNSTDELTVSYEAMLLDNDGFPMIPEDSKFTRALSAYIKKEYFTMLFDMQKINGQILTQALQDYAFAVGACETHFHKLDLGKAESLANLIRSPLIKSGQFNQGFDNLGAEVTLNKH